MRVDDFQSIQIRLASPQEILSWSNGEILKPETINYRTQRPEKDGLFCEKIFGPEKDFQCYCGKYRGVRYKGIICDKCGVEIINSSVRRERLGHIILATPCGHIWFLRGIPSIMGMILDVSSVQLEKVIYFNSYIITQVNNDVKDKFKQAIGIEYKQKEKNIKTLKPNNKRLDKDADYKLRQLKAARDKALNELSSLAPLKTLSEIDYHELSLKYGEAFDAGTGAETLRKIFSKIDLAKEIKGLKKKLAEISQKENKSSKKRKALSRAKGLGPKKRKLLRRLRILESMAASNIRPEWMFLTVIPVLPPDLRPMVQLDGGRYASSDLNDLYRRVINRNNRLKYLLEISAPDVIIRNEKRMLQEAVDALIDNGMRKGQTTIATTGGRRLLKSLADMLKGKQGRFRQNLLGKRVDYSGRSVIVVGPELRMDQVGLPKKLALELFKPFVIRELLSQELVYNIRGASKLIDDKTDDVWAALEKVVKNKLVLLNRAPTLHRLSVQAFEPTLIEGEALQVHPLVCKAFNADFDGDQMAVHLPLSGAAQAEARQIIRSSLNLLKPATGTPIVNPSQDIILGCYFLTGIKDNASGQDTIFPSPEEAILAYEFGIIDLRAKIRIGRGDPMWSPGPDNTPVAGPKNGRAHGPVPTGFIETSVGRLLFNEALPKGFRFINEQLRSKNLEKLTTEIIENYPEAEAIKSLDEIKRLGFEFSTFSGISWGMNDLVVPSKKKEIIDSAEKEIEKINSHYQRGFLSAEEKKARAIEVWQRAKSEIEKLVPEALKGGSVFSIIDAGARGSWVQPVQMAGMKGLVINPAGEIIELPVKASFKEGLNVLEYFISTHGARKGTADTALRTSAAGYMTRRLVDVAHEVIVSEKDCGDRDGLVVYRKDAEEIGQNFLFKILGRVALETIQDPESGTEIVKKGEIIGRNELKKIIEAEIKQVRIASPLTCKSARGVCQNCYGWDLGLNKKVAIGQAVGIVAAQSIGEPGTQLTMRTFHTGGVAGGGDITTGLPRVEEIFEARTPKGEAPIAPVEGIVCEVTDDKVIRILPKDSQPLSGKNKTGKKKGKKGKKELKALEYKIAKDRAIYVKKGQQIKAGDQLCEGNVDLKALFKAAGFARTCQYIIKEIQGIYNSQGAAIHDKHIEVIIRQMFFRVRISEPGDTRFGLGEIVEKAVFLEENQALAKSKKKAKPAQARPVLLGISKVALTTDSFLSAASFQETSRVLIKAAIEGKEDKLRGLKENVIIGKLIPAGTGFGKIS